MEPLQQEPEVRGRPALDLERTVEDRWSEVVAARGDAVAVVDEDGALGYRALDELAEAAAAAVRAVVARDVQARSPLGTLVGHDRSAAVAALAGLQLAMPHLSLDPTVPPARLQEVVRASGTEVVLAGPGDGELARQLGAATVVDLELGAHPPTTALPRQRSRWAPATLQALHGITYTSGSTGAPKGIAVRALTIAHELVQRTAADWNRPDDVVGLVMPLSFGAARGELTSTLFLGAQAHLYDPRARGAGPLPAWLAEHGVTVLAAPPSLLLALVRALPAGQRLAPSLRMVRSSGEKLLSSEAVAIRDALPEGCRLLNVFGSSEATLVSAYEITADTPDLPRPVPAGWPLRDRELRVEREDGAPAAPGEVGELVVVSHYLPAGYWRDEVRTRQRFVPEPDGRIALRTGDLAAQLPDGSYRLAGRRDLSLKIRGNLVEPAEVEAALLAVEGVQEAVVVGRPGRGGRERLVAYLVLRRDAELVRTALLRRELRTRLPSYMVPEAVVYLEELPRTDRGKLDRAALPDPPAHTAGDPDAPRSDWEDAVARLWAEVLELDAVALDDDFFDLGGDSLSGEELVARLASQHGVRASSRVLLDAPTVAEFAAAVALPPAPQHPRLVPLRRTGTRPPLFCVAGAGQLGTTFVPLARALGDDQPVWALQSPGREGRRLPDWSVRRTARDHVAALRQVQPAGPYLLTGHSFGGVVAFEMARRLRAAGERVALLAPMDSFPPHPRALPPVRRRSAADWVRTAVGLLVTSTGRKPELGVPAPFVRQSHASALFYRGRPYAGPTVVVVAEDDEARDRRGAQAWEPYLSGPHTGLDVPGRHTTMLREPHAAVLAERLRAAIDAALR